MIKMYADLRQASNMTGAVKALIEDFTDTKNLSTMSRYQAELANQIFNEYMDNAAMNNEQALGHMYDWGELGEASGRLWRAVLGEARGSTLLSWAYRRSENEVPVGPEASGSSEDTRRGGHVFQWKAPIIENGERVRIRPSGSDWLAIPTNEMPARNGNTSKGGTMWFTRNAISPPVNRIAQGAFTEAWITHFSTIAIKVVEKTLVAETEHHFETYLPEIMRRVPKPRKRSLSRFSHADLLSQMGEKLGHRKNGQFMNAAERKEQILRAERYRETMIV